MNKKLLKKIKPLISINPNVMNGTPRIKNTRIPVSLIVDHYAKGWNCKEIKKFFPDINLSTINKLISFVPPGLKA
jgi:uncharacterized protein (DUF433 family)